ncbi:MAG: GIY-YIG nuclease family protein [Peptococcaceae bacterium]|jgi:hypothetical protein|nr:GIY-YIG nuclease family protein [Peptococcaceae bacterium]
MPDLSKKEKIAQYKAREVVGGVYAIKNAAENVWLLEGTANLTGSKNRFDFAVQTGSCIHLKLQHDWKRLGPSAFTLEVLEEIQRGEDQTSAEFKEDVATLKELWLEKLADQALYNG